MSDAVAVGQDQTPPAQAEPFSATSNFLIHQLAGDVEAYALAAGLIVAQPTTGEGFGRQLQLRTPDGLMVKINEIDADLIT